MGLIGARIDSPDGGVTRPSAVITRENAWRLL